VTEPGAEAVALMISERAPGLFETEDFGRSASLVLAQKKSATV